MNNFLKTTSVLWLFLFTLSCGGTKEQSVEINTPEEIEKTKSETDDRADVSFNDGMVGKVFHNYLEVKMALVNADVPAVQTVAANLAESFTDDRAEMKKLSQQMADADAIEKQRALFAEFTVQVEPLIKGALSEGTIYKKFCPMAFDNQGAYWFADVKEIRNPYFGNEMLTCGEIKETIQ
jgi:hypothetical protein